MPVGTMKNFGKMKTSHPHVNIENMYANAVYVLKVLTFPNNSYKLKPKHVAELLYSGKPREHQILFGEC
jgi:hypothetical protein